MAVDKSRFASQALVDVQDFNCTAGTDFTITFTNCAKVGDVKMINIQVKTPALTALTWYTAAVIPSEYRTLTNKQLLFQINPNSNSVHFDTWTQADGKIQIRPMANYVADGFININGTYI